MRRADYKKLMALTEHLYRGGLPDLGRPHAKAGYRWCVGQADFGDGRSQPWRENLGRDKLLAQHRAREMTDLWSAHVDDCLAQAGFADIEQVQIPPLNRAVAKREAWDAAERAMSEPARLAERANAELHGQADQLGPAVSPGFRLVAVREGIPDDTSASVMVAENLPTSTMLMLRRAAARWLIHLRQRMEAGDASDSYVHRAGTSVKRLTELVEDYEVNGIEEAKLDTIRLAFQSKRTKRGKLRSRGTISTELGHMRDLFQWMSDAKVWSPCRDWERRLKPVHRSDENDDDADAEKTVRSYELSELVRIYAAAPKSLKLWILLALNFAWGATEIATARRRHFKLDSGQRRVARFRHKRRPGSPPVPGRWIAFPQTWELALARMERTPTDEATNPKGLAFLSRDGQRLVRYQTSVNGKERRYDVCASALKEACEEIGVKYRGFYALRRTAIDAVDERWGERMADLFCQHRSRSMTQKHYANKRWRRLFRVIDWWQEQLQPMFDASSHSTKDDSKG